MCRLRYILSILMAFMMGLSSVSAQQMGRPKIGVVLSGGGAKGAAHVQVLKVMEELGIPVDVIVGTSMGSIVGGLYAMGYNADQLDSIIRTQDWTMLLSNSRPRREQHLYSKASSDRFLLNIRFKNRPADLKRTGGLLNGENVERLLSDLTTGFHDSIDFNKDLKIPFACVASDVVTGNEFDMHSGVLAECMRASMSIPGVFAPVHKNGMVLVDGGMSNNFPVDLARQMGADYVVGVNVGDESLKEDELNYLPNILSQIVDLACRKKLQENIDNTDVFIKVDITGYSAASFSREAIDTLLHRGRVAAESKLDDLKALRSKIGLDTTPIVRPRLQVVSAPAERNILKMEHRGSHISLGLRIDNEELAAMLLSATQEFNRDLQFKSTIEARFGKRTYFQINTSFQPVKNWTMEGLYQFNYDEIDVYQKGDFISDIKYRQNQAKLQIYRSWSFLNVAFGALFYNRYYTTLLGNSAVMEKIEQVRSEQNLKYFGLVQYDSRDSHVYAHSGTRFSASYTYCTDDGVNYNGGNGLSIVEGIGEVYIPLTRRGTLTPLVCGRFLSEEPIEFGNRNMIGGTNLKGHYQPQQMPFAGINYAEFSLKNQAVGGLTFTYKAGKNHHFFVAANHGWESREIKNLFREKALFGMATGYGYSSPFGPIELTLNWSSRTERLGCYFNVGYVF